MDCCRPNGYHISEHKEETQMLSEQIYQLRRQKGLSQEQLAEQIGVSRQAISKWESGASTPDLEKLQALSRFFRVSLDVLVGQSDTDESPVPVPQAPPSSHAKPGLYLCLLGALLLLVSGILSLVFPQGMETVNQSSTVTLNGTGILWLLCGVLMAVGVALLLRKK